MNAAQQRSSDDAGPAHQLLEGGLAIPGSTALDGLRIRRLGAPGHERHLPEGEQGIDATILRAFQKKRRRFHRVRGTRHSSESPSHPGRRALR
jgi:hypothetical protein